MKVQVKLFATFIQSLAESVRTQHPEGIHAGRPFDQEMPEGSTLADLAVALCLPEDEIKVIFVNGRAQKLEYRLQPGDMIGIFPPIGGG